MSWHIHFPPHADADWYEWPLFFLLFYCVVYTLIATVGTIFTRRRVKRLRAKVLADLERARDSAAQRPDEHAPDHQDTREH